MRAAVLRRYGLQNLTIEEIEAPQPGPGEVRVAVEAASINPVDWHRASGQPHLVRLGEGLRRPRNTRVGIDGAGVVDALGAGVDDFSIGDRVFGGFDGSFASQAVASTSRIAHVPQTVSCEDAAGVPVAGVTALQAVELAQVEGRRVVVNGASGGVGSFAVQIARAHGAAEVIGVSSGRNQTLVESLGVDRVVDYETEDFTDHEFDVLIDCVGTRSARAVRRAMTPHGHWVLLGSLRKHGLFGPLGKMVSASMSMSFSSQTFTTFIAEETTERLRRLAELLESGEVRPVIDRLVLLDVVTGAFDYLATTRARGKVLILPAGVRSTSRAPSVQNQRTTGAAPYT